MGSWFLSENASVSNSMQTHSLSHKLQAYRQIKSHFNRQGPQVFQMSRRHLKSLATRKVAWNSFLTEGPQVPPSKNYSPWRPTASCQGFFHSSLYVLGKDANATNKEEIIAPKPLYMFLEWCLILKAQVPFTFHSRKAKWELTSYSKYTCNDETVRVRSRGHLRQNREVQRLCT